MDRLSKEVDLLSSSVIHRLETGQGAVTLLALYRYAEALGVPLVSLFQFDEKSLEPRPMPRVWASEDLPGRNSAFRTHLPLYSLEAAAGHFGQGREVEPLGWIEVNKRLDKNMFVAQARGRSMEPKIRDGDYLVFRANPEGSRQNKIVLAQHRGIADPDTGGAYSVKRYKAEKARELSNRKVSLLPTNPDYPPIVLYPKESSEVVVVAEYLFSL